MRQVSLPLLVSLVLTTGCAYRLSPADALADEAAQKISQGNLTDAEPLLKQAIAKNPHLAWPHYNLATCLHARRSFTDALAEYREAARLFGAHQRGKSVCLYGIASLLDDRNDWPAALEAYEAYLQFTGGEPNETRGVAMARARVTVIRDAVQRNIPAGKPLRGVALILPPGSGTPTVPAGDAPKPAPPVVAPPAAPLPPAPAAKPAPAPAKPAPAAKPAATPAAAKGAAAKPATPAAKPATPAR
ncbi:MAG TPA: tetratricopeptide repeat protein [Polyangia bacterium]|jgi:hypothetical protein